MLIGQYEGTLGEKKQVAFPKKFREVLGDTLIVTKGFDGHLIIVSKNHWETLLEGTLEMPFTNKESRETQRFLLGNATEVMLDRKGRFVLPEYLREYAGISKDILFAGIRRFVEMWDKKRWDEQQQQLSKNIIAITERLSEKE
jgi:MraZ protein